MTKNPFGAPEVFLKVGLYGPSGSGKTRAALTFPRCAVIDTEGGTGLYATVPGIAHFDVLRTSSLAQVHEAIAYLREDKGQTYSTVVLDSLTVIWLALKRRYADERGGLTYLARSQINLLMSELYTALTDLPLHCVATMHLGTEYEADGKNLKKAGEGPAADLRARYPFDVIVRLLDDHSGVIEKQRGEGLVGPRLPDVSWTTLQPLLADVVLAGEFRDTERVKAWMTRWGEQGVTSKDLSAALGVKKWSDWLGGFAAADVKVRDLIAQKPDTAAEKEGEPEEPPTQPTLLE